jgi:hypothetical protein
MMLLQARKRPIIYGDPSLCLARQKYQDHFDYRNPVRSGDLHQLLEENPYRKGCVLITDGVFGESMAVSPCECMDLIHAGWLLLGASSIGALRAADCSSIGMVGIGEVFMGYRMGYYHSDADVAVLYQGEDHTEISVSIAHADYIIRQLALCYFISGSSRNRLLRDLRNIVWYNRNPHVVSNLMEFHFDNPTISKEFFVLWRKPEANPKVRDALLACDMLSSYYLKRYAIIGGFHDMD